MDSSTQRIDIPIHHYSNSMQSRDTTAQWINDSSGGNEKYRMRINIEGFNQNEVSARVDGNRLLIYGECIENKSQGTSKKIIEKSYNLPADVDTFRPYVTFPSPVTMQVDFPSKNVPTRSIQSNRHALPSQLNTKNDPSLRRIPIINSRESSLVPEHSTYKFHSDQTNNPPQSIILKTHRFGSPVLSSITEEGSIRSSTPQSDTSSETEIFPADFNSDLFYRSIFQPEIFTDDRQQRYIELKLDVHDSNPNDIQVSINNNDLIVQIDKTNFSKQIILPSNIDAASLSVHHHHHDKKLYITIKLLDEYSSIKYI